MFKRYVLKKLYEFGDTLLSTKDGNSVLVTTDLNNKYIKKRRNFLEKNIHTFKTNTDIVNYRKFKRERAIKQNDTVQVFNWTNNNFEVIEVKNITYLTPLSKVLNNEPRESTETVL